MDASNGAKMQPLESVESFSSDSATKVFLKGQSKQSVGLCLQNLEVHGFSEPTFFQHTVSSYFTLWPTYFLSLVGHGHRRKVSILHDVNGVVESGEMLLVLGRPGSGCTTLLKTLAGSAHGVQVKEDAINYQGIPYSEFHKKCKRDALYLAEDDVHFPELTLEETLSFASETRAPNPKLAHTSPAENARLVSSTLNLEGALKTPIGNDLIRGLSGGEKKRVSIAEALLSGSAVQCYDNSTRGLDSATAFDFVSILRNSTRTLGTTAVVTIYQVSEEIYSTFDKVSVLYEGRQIFFGSTQNAAEYFTSIGFVRPARSTTADFLASLTNPAQHIIQDGFEDRVPRTPDDFVATWKRSTQYGNLMKEIKEFSYVSPAQSGNSLRYLRNKESDASGKGRSSIYTISLYHQVRICVQRAFLRLRNNLAPAISGIVGNTIVAVILGSVFINLSEDTSTFQTRAILIYYATMINACTPAFEVLTMWAQRPIVEKQSRYVFYHPVAEGIASMIADIPNKVATSLFFNICLYFITNLRREPDSFFTFWLFSMLCMITMSMLFRMVGSLSRTYGQTLAPVAVIIFNFLIYAGLIVPPDYMVPALGWIRWINPVAYTYESLMINEFGNRQFACGVTVPSGPSYGLDMNGKTCVAVGALPGKNFVDGNTFLDLKYGYSPNHLWRNLAILIAMMIGFCCVHLVATEYIQAQKSKGDVLLFRRQNQLQIKADEESGPVTDTKIASESQLTITALPQTKEMPITQPELQKQCTVFHWSNLSYELKVGKENKKILDGIDGWVKPGTLTALMGTTGAGKTTLLDVLASRKSVGVISGDIFVNGTARDKEFQRKTGYIQQNDLHLPTATVREAVTFSALLRQPARIPKAEKLAYVDTVLLMLA